MNDTGTILPVDPEEMNRLRQDLRRHRRLFNEIVCERSRQDAAWGEQNHDPFLYLTILGEEYGEACQAALQTRFGGTKGGIGRLRAELVQVAAVAVAAIECIDRGNWKWGGHCDPDDGPGGDHEAD